MKRHSKYLKLQSIQRRAGWLIAFAIFISPAFSQSFKIDSLCKVLRNATHDTTRVGSYLMLGLEYFGSASDSAFLCFERSVQLCRKNMSDLDAASLEYKVFKFRLSKALNNLGVMKKDMGLIDEALLCHQESLKLRQELNDKAGISASFNNLGLIYKDLGDIRKATGYYTRSLNVSREIGDKKGIANAFNNLGVISHDQGNIASALEYYSQSLKVKEELGDLRGIAGTLSNIGTIHEAQGDVPKAIEYYNRSLKIREEMGDKTGISICYHNLACAHNKQGNRAKAIELYLESVRLCEETGDKKGIANSYSNLGAIYHEQGKADKAQEFYRKNLKVMEEIGDKAGIALALLNTASIFSSQKKYGESIRYAEKSLALAKELGFPEYIMGAAHILHAIYKNTGNYDKSIEHYGLYLQMYDSLNNETTRKAAYRSHLQYEYEKKAIADSVSRSRESSVKNVMLEKQKAEISLKKNQQYALFGGLGLFMIFSGFIYSRFKTTKRQNGIIERQKEEVEKRKCLLEEKQRQILDSINYARRIQQAHLPTEKRIERFIQMTKKI